MPLKMAIMRPNNSIMAIRSGKKAGEEDYQPSAPLTLQDLIRIWWAQHYLNPESYPRPLILPFGTGTLGGPKFSGDVKGFQQIIYKGQKPWTTVGTTKSAEQYVPIKDLPKPKPAPKK